MMANAGEQHGVKDDTPLLDRPPAVLADHGNMEGRPRHRRAATRNAAEITIKDLSNKPFKLQVDLARTTIQQVKAKIEEEKGYPKRQQRLVFGQQILEPDHERTLTDWGIRDGSTLVLIIRLRGGGEYTDDVQSRDDEETQMDRNKGWTSCELLISKKSCIEAWELLKSQYNKSKMAVCGTAPNDLKETIKYWSNYSQKALWFAIAMFSAYLDHSTSTSLTTTTTTTRDIFFVIVFLLFLASDGAFSMLLMLLSYNRGIALVYISGFLLELVLCLLMVSFNPYYAFSILIVLVLIIAVALLQPKLRFNVDDEYLEHFFDLSQGIVNCGGLITVILGHYLVGQFNNGVAMGVGLFFFATIVLGVYLMIVITARVVTSRHAWYLAIVLMALLALTLIISSIAFVTQVSKSLKHYIRI